eukprot:4611233-Alexandrium_andersonii.AAC.1
MNKLGHPGVGKWVETQKRSLSAWRQAGRAATPSRPSLARATLGKGRGAGWFGPREPRLLKYGRSGPQCKRHLRGGPSPASTLLTLSARMAR